MKTTLRDVAERAGVSASAVSYVLNEVPGKRISDATRQRVRAAAEELSYRPNRLARGLRLQRSNTLGFISDNIATRPHAGLMISGAQDAAAEHGSLLMMMNSDRDPELADREVRALLDRQVDGIIYAAEYHQVVTPSAALHGTNAVLLDARTETGSLSSVVPDEVGGALTAVRELTDHGHRRIGFINHTDDIPAVALRLKGFQLGLKAAGRRFHPELVASDISEAEGGKRAASVLLDLPDRPTALFCFNDRMAMGAYQAAADRGLSVPDDLSIIGFDNQEIIARSLSPGLSTVALPHYEMGHWAVDALMNLIKSDGEEPTRQVTLPCPLVRRASVGPPPRT